MLRVRAARLQATSSRPPFLTALFLLNTCVFFAKQCGAKKMIYIGGGEAAGARSAGFRIDRDTGKAGLTPGDGVTWRPRYIAVYVAYEPTRLRSLSVLFLLRFRFLNVCSGAFFLQPFSDTKSGMIPKCMQRRILPCDALRLTPSHYTSHAYHRTNCRYRHKTNVSGARALRESVALNLRRQHAGEVNLTVAACEAN